MTWQALPTPSWVKTGPPKICPPTVQKRSSFVRRDNHLQKLPPFSGFPVLARLCIIILNSFFILHSLCPRVSGNGNPAKPPPISPPSSPTSASRDGAPTAPRLNGPAVIAAAMPGRRWRATGASPSPDDQHAPEFRTGIGSKDINPGCTRIGPDFGLRVLLTRWVRHWFSARAWGPCPSVSIRG